MSRRSYYYQPDDSSPRVRRFLRMRFMKKLKRKVFFSNELKQVLFTAFVEAKKSKIYVTPEILLYALLSQPGSLSARLISSAVSPYKYDKGLTATNLAKRIYGRNKTRSRYIVLENKEIWSDKLWSENERTPWLKLEVKDLLKKAVIASLKKSPFKNKKVMIVVQTKDVLFELLKKRSIIELLQSFIFKSY